MTTAVEASLARFLDSPGVTGVALVDAVTGLTYGVAGDVTEAGDGQESSEFASSSPTGWAGRVPRASWRVSSRPACAAIRSCSRWAAKPATRCC